MRVSMMQGFFVTNGRTNERTNGQGDSRSWMLGLSGTSSYAVFVYLCILYLYFCIYAFVMSESSTPKRFPQILRVESSKPAQLVKAGESAVFLPWSAAIFLIWSPHLWQFTVLLRVVDQLGSFGRYEWSVHCPDPRDGLPDPVWANTGSAKTGRQVFTSLDWVAILQPAQRQRSLWWAVFFGNDDQK